MYDKIEMLQDAVIQHGALNNRIYLIKPGRRDISGTIEKLDELAEKNGYTKIIAKVPARDAEVFQRRGYRQEASIPRFYNGMDEATFLARYLAEDRRREKNGPQIREILAIAGEKSGRGTQDEDGLTCSLGIAGQSDVQEMSRLYREVFQTYPFPIHDPQYLLETMESHVLYFWARDQQRIVALSSAEMDPGNRTVEMTDFATLPQARGKDLAVTLLQRMETAMKQRGMCTAYTIARALSAGMNITFAKLGYIYSGTLINNTNICGRIESMNVWYKHLG